VTCYEGSFACDAAAIIWQDCQVELRRWSVDYVVRGEPMISTELDRDQQQVYALTEAEATAIESGDADRYFLLLSDDAQFMPPNIASKTGDDLRQWLRDFLQQVTIKYIEFAHGETVIRDDLACHSYTCDGIQGDACSPPASGRFLENLPEYWNADPSRAS
jgi:ketosteroid isomerase-like protein